MRTAGILLICAAMASVFATEPRPSPTFSILRVKEPPLPLDSFRGKVVLLAFIDTNCSHCQELTRELGPIAKEYTPRGVQFLECAFNEAAQVGVPGFIQQFQPPFPVGYNSRAEVDRYLERSIMDARPLYVPHLVFLDRKGVIQEDVPGESDFMKNPVVNIKAELDKLLSTGAAKPAAKKGAARKKK